MVKKKSIDEDDYMVFSVNAKSTLEQACNLLFRAEEKAIATCDVDSLMKIAAGWMELHEYLNGRPEEHKKVPLGFTGGLRSQENDGESDDELADAIADEGES